MRCPGSASGPDSSLTRPISISVSTAASAVERVRPRAAMSWSAPKAAASHAYSRTAAVLAR